MQIDNNINYRQNGSIYRTSYCLPVQRFVICKLQMPASVLNVLHELIIKVKKVQTIHELIIKVKKVQTIHELIIKVKKVQTIKLKAV